jgi:hypothetical protein
MPTLIGSPTRITAAGNKPKLIDEYIGRVNSRHEQVSLAHMRSPSGWIEPGQRPEFEEYTVVLRGLLRVEYEGGALDVNAGQAVVAQRRVPRVLSIWPSVYPHSRRCRCIGMKPHDPPF